MRTQTIERTDTDERVDDGTDSDTPKYFHYVKKDKIAESAVDGYARRRAVRRGVSGDEGRQARFAGLPGLQADLREAQDVASPSAVAVRGRAPAGADRRRCTFERLGLLLEPPPGTASRG